MSFPTYPAYKDSGVEWLDQVPDHWSSVPIKYMALERNSLFLDGDWIESKDISSDGIRYITTGNVGEGTYKEQGAGFISEETFHALRCTEVYEGDVLVSRLNNPIGRACVVPDLGGRVVTSVDNVIFRPDLKFYKKFIVYLFSSEEYFKHTSNLARGATMQRISRGLLGNIRVVTPSLEEQTQIARFLDHETARIDALIEEQQLLIELLKEKRQAVISHAVTKGLDPTVPMKDSGVEWLGEVPAHWNVGTLRWYATIQGGVAKGKDYEGRETVVMPYLRVANVQNGYVDLAEVKEIAVLESEVERYRLRAGDVLMNEGGDNDKLGRGTVWQAQIDPCLHQNHVFAIRPNGLLRAEWLAAFTQAEQARTYFYLNSKQSTNLASISASNVMSLALPIPSEKEQLEILTYLEADRSRHEELTAVAVSTVELLQERRSALISAAVTGKIDVRGWQPPVSTQAPELAVAEVV
ncbi:TPA: restriction endonuclease subunit S [Pseudomonas aeruginosa]|nr:restriction endonuclease subunit S [Pseudomonas aeruginosa]MBH4045924.1 restriction endonuclease subunit S [Pseudomonas aeruginosa]HCF4446034.1 restriction endonuclease subunit S [Pseudomonas aeruginosa]HCL4372629.1 restriction endonuclease subunit S [Pseudomonas aeruginosa]